MEAPPSYTRFSSPDIGGVFTHLVDLLNPVSRGGSCGSAGDEERPLLPPGREEEGVSRHSIEFKEIERVEKTAPRFNRVALFVSVVKFASRAVIHPPVMRGAHNDDTSPFFLHLLRYHSREAPPERRGVVH